MSLGLNKTKRRILSVRSTQKITKAMGMVATVKLKRFKDGFEQESAYRASLTRAMAAAFHYDKLTASHYGMENEEVEGILYLVITSNLGLCAGYNNEVFRYAESLIDPEIDTILPIGEKGRAHFLRDPRFKHVLKDEENLDLSMEPRLINRAALHLKNAFNQKKYRKIVIIYTRYVNSLRFVPDQKTLLPFSLEYEKEPYEEYCPLEEDRDGQRQRQRGRDPQPTHHRIQQSAPGRDHPRDHRSRRRREWKEIKEEHHGREET